MFGFLGFLFSLWGLGSIAVALIGATAAAVVLHADWKVYAIIGAIAGVYLTEHYVYRSGEDHRQARWDNAVAVEGRRQKDEIDKAGVLEAQLEQARDDLDAAAAKLEAQHEADLAAIPPVGSCYPPDTPADIEFLHKLIGK